MLNKPQTEALSRESSATIIRMMLEKNVLKDLRISQNTQLNNICVFAGRFFPFKKKVFAELFVSFFIKR